MADKLDEIAGEKILNMFLDLSNFRIKSIIRLKSYTEKNSTYVKVSQAESTYKDRRLTRNFRSFTSARATISSLSKLNGKVPHRRGKRESGKKK